MKMIEIIMYRNTKWSETKDYYGNYTLTITSPDKRKLLINMEFIASISPTPIVAHEGEKTHNVYFINTQIAYGRGINGIDYRGYYITEESYKNLMKNIEVL